MSKTEDIEMRLLLEAIFRKYHYDFRDYSMASIKRRLTQARDKFNCSSFSALQDMVLHDASMLPELLSFLTVQVSEMFRDPSYFRMIREKVVPHLKTYPSLKVWIAGCSSGEELYSFAILFREEGLEERTMFYATDINPDALKKAEAGVYDIDRIQLFTENHRKSGGKSSLSDYYTAAYGAATFDKSLRQRTVFSDHSLVTDMVFAEMQMISCRNVLIYFDRDLQDRVIGLFKDSLPRKGFLGLGAKESLRFSNHADAFVEFSREEKSLSKAGGSMSAPDYDAVVIGASAGAVEALSNLLPLLPVDFALPVMIVVHLPAGKKSILAELLQTRCAVTVQEAEDKVSLQPGTVYFAPSDYHLLAEGNGQLSLSSEEPVLFSRPSIDVLFETAADAYGPRLIGVVLTGANEDGAQGLKRIIDQGGTGLVQSPELAFARMMPQSAIDACPTAEILTLEQIADYLKKAGTQ